MVDVTPLPNATVLFDEYEIVRVLGAGGFGITYLARHLPSDMPVAVKEYFPRSWCKRDQAGAVAPGSSRDREQFDWGLRRFLEEAQRLAKFNHPNIVRAERYFSVNGTAYMVLSYEEGQTLGEWLADRTSTPGQSELDAILEPLLSALDELHGNGVFHRDLSPDNIVVRKDGTPVLLDFGASREQISRHSQVMTAIIKPGYSPIEQYDNKATRQGPWSDIYALGAVIYGIISGQQPPESPARFAHDDYVALPEVAPPGVYREAFLHAMDWSLRVLPADRPQSIADWRRCLYGKADVPAATVHVAPGAPTAARQAVGTEGVLAPIPSGAGGARNALIAIGLIVLLCFTSITAFVLLAGSDSPLPEQTAPARQRFEALELSRTDRLRVARGLYHMGFAKNAKLDLDFVNRGRLSAQFRANVAKFQGARKEDPSGYPTLEQVQVLAAKGERRTEWEEENSIAILKRQPAAAWLRIEAVLLESRDLPKDQKGPAALRAALKRYQARSNIKPTGYLSESLFYKLLSTPVRLKVAEGHGGRRFGDWYFARNGNECRIWTNVSQLAGRSLLLDAPRVEITRDVGAERDAIGFDLLRMAKLDRFVDTNGGLYFKGGGNQYQLQIDAGRVKPRKLSGNTVSEEVIKKFYSYAGQAHIGAASKLGGPLVATFSTRGFATAFAHMAKDCGPQIMRWVQRDWAAVYRNARGQFFSVSRQLTRQDAMSKAKAKCAAASKGASCSWAAAFQAPKCYAIARPPRTGRPVLATAKSARAARKQADQQCRQLYGRKTKCTISESLCSDGSTG